jgi:hypothetical protein
MPRSANKSSLLTSDETVFGATGRTVFAVAQGNALARGFWFAAQPETIAATVHTIAHTNFGEAFDASDRNVATRTRSKM